MESPKISILDMDLSGGSIKYYALLCFEGSDNWLAGPNPDGSPPLQLFLGEIRGEKFLRYRCRYLRGSKMKSHEILGTLDSLIIF